MPTPVSPVKFQCNCYSCTWARKRASFLAYKKHFKDMHNEIITVDHINPFPIEFQDAIRKDCKRIDRRNFKDKAGKIITGNNENLLTTKHN